MMHQWIMGRRWFICHCSPQNEALAATSAKELGWVVFYPRYREKLVRPHRKPVERILPYLPGYIFVEASRYAGDGRPLSPWELGKAKGVNSVLKVGGEHAAVDDTDEVMQALLKMSDDYGFVQFEAARKPITLFKDGDRVVIRDGSFAGFEAVISRISKNRKVAKVWAQIFGRPTQLTVETEQLKPAKARKIAA